MSKRRSISKSLIDADEACLIVIDVQKIFLEKLTEEQSEQLVKRIVWLVNVATRSAVPLVVTAEDIEKNGSIIPELADRIPAATKTHNKMVFGLAADPDILRAIQKTGRDTAILVGLETDVCVAHSALGLLEKGYHVVVIEDATASPGKSHQYGLSRIQSAGALVSNVKSLFYEWMRTVEGCREFYSKYGDELGDPGIAL